MITDKELIEIEKHGLSVPLSIGMWQQYFSMVLGRSLSRAETEDAIKRVHARNPSPGPTYGDLTRSE